ncbi:MAG: methyltransferase domain-containing protein [Planctomycetes bacterium]|nr:methyltransferase domain-containing protein [Planctomycetota bacterium]
MWRALMKGAILAGFGRFPGGTRLYRHLTRERMGTQATHVDKLRRVWPGYVGVWEGHGTLRMEGLRVWVHEAGWTPYAPLINYLLTGSGGILTNVEGRLLDKYLSRAVNGSLGTALPPERFPRGRRRRVEGLRWCMRVEDALREIGAEVHQDVNPASLPLPSSSVDLCHSGGTLEHYRPGRLRGFLAECFRILRPGGVASHVFDHRDHLFHADARWPFLAHFALPGPVYELLCGHPLGYHNRLLPTEVERLFEEAGFERIVVRRMILPGREYVEEKAALRGKQGLSRMLLAPRFRPATDEDLRTAAAHYLYRKPAAAQD